MSKYCCVEGCLNGASKGMTMHYLPSNQSRMQEWTAILKKDESKDITYSRGSRICSAHFEDSAFIVLANGAKMLTKDAKPTILPWSTLKSNRQITYTNKNKDSAPLFTICGNCCSSIKNDGMCVRKYSVKDSRTEMKKYLYVHDVIAYLYGISWDSFIKYLNKKKTIGDCELKSKMEPEEIGVTNRIKTVALCNPCASLLYANYIAHLNFERVSKSESIVKQLKQFQKLGFAADDLQNAEASKSEKTATPSVNSETDKDTLINTNINDFLKVEINDSRADIESPDVPEKQMPKDVISEEANNLLFNDFNFEELDETFKPPEEPVDVKCEEEFILPIGSSMKTVDKSIPTVPLVCLKPPSLVPKAPNKSVPDFPSAGVSGSKVLNYPNVVTPKNSVLVAKSVPKKTIQLLGSKTIANFKVLNTTEQGFTKKKVLIPLGKANTVIPKVYCKMRTITNNTGKHSALPGNVFSTTNILFKTPVTEDINERTTDALNVNHYNCIYCLKAFTNEEAWNIHTTECKKKIPNTYSFTCKICDKTFTDYFQYKYVHAPTHGKEQQKKMKCNICGKLLPNSKRLKRHVTKVHNKIMKYSAPLVRNCSICRKVIIGKGGKLLEAHMKIHDHIWYFCKLCPAKFKTVPEKRQHRNAHKEEEPLFCKICKRMFYYIDSLEKHELRHKQEKKFACDLCAERFHEKEGLKNHKSSRHNDANNSIRDFVCHVCGSALKTAGILRTHLQLHLEEKKGGFECDVCGKVMKHSSSLREHKKKVHYKVINYECSICGQKLSGPKMLKHHESLHADPNFKGRPRKPKQWRNKIRITEEDEAPSASSESSQNEAQQMQSEKSISTRPKRNVSRRRFLDDYV